MIKLWQLQRVLLVCLASAALVSAQFGSQTVAQESADGSQSGSITLEDDGSGGSVTAVSSGGRSASASASLTVGGGQAQGEYTAQGDTSGVSDSFSTGGGQAPVEPVTQDEQAASEDDQTDDQQDTTPPPPPPPPAPVPVPIPPQLPPDGLPFEQVEDESVGEDQGRPGMPGFPGLPCFTCEDEDEEEDEGPFSFGFPTFGFSYGSSIGGGSSRVHTSVYGSTSQDPGPDPKKICLVSDDSDFDRLYAEGYEVTLVKKYNERSVEIVRAVQWGGSSSRTSIITQRIPEDVKKQCNVTEADLGIQVQEPTSFHFSGQTHGSGSSGQSYAAAASRAMWRKLCEKESFKRLEHFKERCEQVMSGGGDDGDFSGPGFTDDHKLG